MNEIERWIYLDGPEPELLRPALDALRDLPPATEDDVARAVRRFMAARANAGSAGDVPPASLAQPIRAGGARLGVAEPAEPLCEETTVAARDEPAPASDRPAPAAPAAPSSPSIGHLVETGLGLDLSRAAWEARGKLPFGPPLADRPRAARTLHVPKMRSKLGDTAPIDDDRMARIVAALPFNKTTVGTGTIPFPRLTLEQYASLHAELLVGTGRREETLFRYRVLQEASFGALSAHWEERFRAQPEERARFDQMLATFTDWLRRHPR
ncbi:MAG: hypothetical protein U0359_39385 [Byssovorax sp.]